MNKKKIIAGAVISGGLFFLLLLLFMMTHGTIEAKGFCNFCHRAYYDVDEYAFNEKVGMKKPSGMLVGCAECHPQPYKEFKESPHFDTDMEDMRPGCSNCHEPHSFFKWLKYMYYSPPEWERVQLSLHDNTLWEEEVMPDLAIKARKTFVVNKSKVCKQCHLPPDFKKDVDKHKEALAEADYNVEKVKCKKCHPPIFPPGKKAHKKALAKANDKFDELGCVTCHYNFVHDEVPWDNKKEDIKAWLKEVE